MDKVTQMDTICRSCGRRYGLHSVTHSHCPRQKNGYVVPNSFIKSRFVKPKTH